MVSGETTIKLMMTIRTLIKCMKVDLMKETMKIES